MYLQNLMVKLGDGFGVLLAEMLSSPASSVRELVVAENLLSDAFAEAFDEGMRKRTSSSPLRSLDASGNKISDRWRPTTNSVE